MYANPIEALESRLLLSSAATWQNVAVGGGGAVIGIVADPNVQGLMYIRTDIGGAYRWNAAIAAWIPITESMSSAANFGIDSLCVDPSDAGTVYILTGQYTYDTAAIFKSTNEGNTWTQLSIPAGVVCESNGANKICGERLQVDPNNPNILYLASRNEGLWKSTNDGGSWSQVSGVPGGDTADDLGESFVTFDKGGGMTGNATSTIYVGVYDAVSSATDGGIWKSTNGGSIWVQMSGGLNSPARGIVGADGTFYVTDLAVSGNAAHNGGVDTAARSASALTNITPNASLSYCAIAVDPTSPQTVVVSQNLDAYSSTTYESTNGGGNWTVAGSVQGTANLVTRQGSQWFGEISALAIDPYNHTSVWMADWLGVLQTGNIANTATAWNFLYNGIEEIVPLDLVSAPAGSPLLVGSADINGFADGNLATPAANQFSNPSYGSTTSLDFCEANPNVWARVFDNFSGGGTGAYSTNDGQTWTQFASTPSGARGGRIAVSATNAGNFVWDAEDGDVYYTTNSGATWTQATSAPSIASSEFLQNMQPLTSDRVASGTFYLVQNVHGSSAGYAQVWISTNSGATWTKAAAIAYSTGRTDVYQYKVIAAPGIAGEVWVDLGYQGIYKSTNSATSFAGQAGVGSVGMIAFGAPAPGHTNPAIYLDGSANSVSGIFRSNDDGVTWTKIDNSSTPINDSPEVIGADRQTYGLVYIGTNGRGIYYDASQANAWKAAVGGNWTDPTMWSLGHVPLAGEDVLISQPGNYTVTLQGSDVVNTLILGNATSTPTLNLIANDGNGNAALTIANGFTNYGDLTLTDNSLTGNTASITVSVGALVNAAGATITTAGTSAANGDSINGTIVNAGTIMVTAPNGLSLNDSSGNNTGNISVTGGKLTFGESGNFTNAGNITVAAGTLAVATAANSSLSGGNLANNATVQLLGTEIFAMLSGNGTTTISGNAALTVNNVTQASVINNGTSTINGNGTVGQFTGNGTATVGGSGTLAVGRFTQANLVNNGVMQITGNGTIGQLTGAGNLTIGNGSSNITVQLAPVAIPDSFNNTQRAVNVAAGSTLDIANNALLLNYAGGSSPLAAVQTAVAGGGMISSTANAGGAGQFTVGYADATELASLPGGNVKLMYTLTGDALLTGTVNFDDFSALQNNYNQSSRDWSQGDWNHDGLVNFDDYSLLQNNYNQSVKATPTLAWATPAAITYGTGLSAAQLDAAASVPGSFAYSPALGAVPHAGTQTLSVTFTPTDTTDYYTVTRSVNLTVNKAVLTVTANNQTRAYGAANPTFTYGFSGFVNGDTSSVVSGAASLSTAANSSSTPNTYSITVAANTLAANDYTFNLEGGNLTVTQAATATALTSSNASWIDGGTVIFTATITPASGNGATGTVRFQIDGGNVGTPVALSGNTASYTTSTLTLGNHIIVAVYSGDSNFTGSTAPACTQTVGLATVTYTLSINDDGAGNYCAGHYAVYASDNRNNAGLASYDIHLGGTATITNYSPAGNYDDGTGDGASDEIGFTLFRTANNSSPATAAQDTIGYADGGKVILAYGIGQTAGNLASDQAPGSTGAVGSTTQAVYAVPLELIRGIFTSAAPIFTSTSLDTGNIFMACSGYRTEIATLAFGTVTIVASASMAANTPAVQTFGFARNQATAEGIDPAVAPALAGQNGLLPGGLPLLG